MLRRLTTKISSNKHLQELLHGGIISFLLQALGILISYVFILIVSRKFGAHEMGIYALSLTLLNIFVLFGKFGLDTSIVKFIGELSEKKTYSQIKSIYIKAIKIALPINIALTVIMLLSSPYIATYIFQKPDLSIYFQMMSLSLMLISLRFINANSLRGLRDIRSYTFIQSISVYFISSIFLLFFLALELQSTQFIFISFMLGVFFSFLLSTYLWIKKSYFFDYPTTHSITSKKILSVSLPLLITSSVMMILDLSDTIMLGIYRTEAEVGIYNIVYKIATAGMIVFMAFGSIFAPKIASAFQNNKTEELKNIIKQTNNMVFLFSFPLYLIIFLCPSYLLGLFGQDFVDGAQPLIILSISFLIKSLLGSSEYVLQMSNYQKSLILYSTIAAASNIGLNYFLIPQYGLNGAATASAVSLILFQILITMKVQQHFKVWKR